MDSAGALDDFRLPRGFGTAVAKVMPSTISSRARSCRSRTFERYSCTAVATGDGSRSATRSMTGSTRWSIAMRAPSAAFTASRANVRASLTRGSKRPLNSRRAVLARRAARTASPIAVWLASVRFSRRVSIMEQMLAEVLAIASTPSALAAVFLRLSPRQSSPGGSVVALMGPLAPKGAATTRRRSDTTVSHRAAASESLAIVCVTRDPGWAFEDCVASLAAQDPPVPVLIIDDGSAEDLSSRVAAVAPKAFVRRLDESVGYAAAVQVGVEAIDGAEAFVFCHDDVALAPDVVRRLVAARSQFDAGIVGAKIVAWDDHSRIVTLGPRVGPSGQLAERSAELDQGQHDVPSDVGAVDGAALLVAAWALERLGGFSARLTPPGVGPDVGEDLDLCWRARLAGIRVVLAGSARVAHEGNVHDADAPRFADGPAPVLGAVSRKSRNALSATLSYGPRLSLPVVLFRSLLRSLFGDRVDTTEGRPRLGVRSRVLGWSTAAATGVVGTFRSGGSRRRGVRAEIWAHHHDAVAAADARDPARRLRAVLNSPSIRSGMAVALTGLAVLVFGSRTILAQRLPRVGQVTLQRPASELLRALASGLQTSGFASDGSAPPGYAPAALLSFVGFGRSGRWVALAAICALICGVLGSLRLAAHIVAPVAPPDSPRGPVLTRLAAGLTYFAVPLGYNALADGQVEVLIGIAALPWLVLVLLRESGWLRAGPPKRPVRGLLRTALPLVRVVVPVALVGAIAAPVAVLGCGVAVVLVFASLAERRLRAAATLGASILAAVAGTSLLLLPWSADAMVAALGRGELPADGSSLLGVRVGPQPLSVLGIFEFGVGPLSGPWFLLLFVGPLAAVLVTTGPRFRWTLRWWFVIVCTLTIAIASGPLALDHLPPPSLVLVVVALAVSQLSALAVAGLGFDDEAIRFGWRPVAMAGALAASALAALAVPVAATDGQWGAGLDTEGALGWITEVARDEPGFRVVWLGAPEVLPVAQRRVSDELSMGVTRDGIGTVGQAWPARATTAQAELARVVLGLGSRGQVRGGQQLGSFAVRYVVIVDPLVAGGVGDAAKASATALLKEGLGRQLDLQARRAPRGFTVYENLAWRPVATAESPDGTWSALPAQGSPRTWNFVVPSGKRLVVAETFSDRWTIRSGDRAVAVEPINNGYGMRTVEAVAGRVSVRYNAPTTVRLATAAQLAVGAALLVLAIRFRPSAAPNAGFGTWDDVGLDDAPPAELYNDDLAAEEAAAFGLVDEPVWHAPKPRLALVTSPETAVGADAGAEVDAGADVDVAITAAVGADIGSDRREQGAGETDGALASQLWDEWSQRRGLQERRKAPRP